MSVMRKYYDNEPPKLVLFSDSRQAAAKLAAGIELDHYRDTFRSVLLNGLEEKSYEKDLLRKYYKDKKSLSQEENLAMRALSHQRYYDKILEEINFGEQPNPILTEFFQQRHSISLDRLEANLVNTLFQAGINPAGSFPSVNVGNDNKSWATNYDFRQGTFKPKDDGLVGGSLHDKIIRKAKIEMLLTIFCVEQEVFGIVVARSNYI